MKPHEITRSHGPEISEASMRVEAIIDGVHGVYPEGMTILQAAKARGIAIPILCHDDRVHSGGACRLCLVEVAGHGCPAAACVTPLASGMQVTTQSDSLAAYRRATLALLAHEYPHEAANAFPEKPFPRLLREYGLTAGGNGKRKGDDPPFTDHRHPYLDVDMARCVTCFRCVRVCDELEGQFVWRPINRGAGTRIVPGLSPSLLDSSCVSCGACADACPTGAIDDRRSSRNAPPDQWTRTVCPYCGVGCELLAGSSAGRISRVRPAPDARVNKGHLCVKGRYAFDFVHARDRETQPLVREGGTWRPVSWDRALRIVSDRLSRVRAAWGPDSIGVLGSARATNEENYLTQKFARVVLGTNNVDCCARVCHGPTAAAMKQMLGTGAATNSFDDIERAHGFLIFGCNPTENHPIVGARIRQAVLRGAKLIVVDPRAIELARHADLHLAIQPGTNVALCNAIAHVLVNEHLFDHEAVTGRMNDFAEFQTFIQRSTPEWASEITGVSPDLIRSAARLYAACRPAMCFHGLGVTENIQGGDGVMALTNLALLTGNLGRPGSGVNPLRGQNNVQGAAHMGCEPHLLAGSVALPQGRELSESVWHAPVPRGPGLNLMQMIDAAGQGDLHGLWAIGYDIALTNPQYAVTRASLAKVNVIVVQDLFLNESAREFGHVFLPACSSFEKDGTFMNSERRVQRVRRVIPPIGKSRPDWEIICAVADMMGHGSSFSYRTPEEIWNEIRSVWPEGAGITYERLEVQGLQWPCPDPTHPGTTVLHTAGFSHGRRAALARVDFRPSAERACPDFPYLLTTGRTLYHFNAGTMTMRTPNVILRPEDTLDISPADAAALGITEHTPIRVWSAHGEARLPAHIDPRIKPGGLFATFHTRETLLNRVTGPGRDSMAMTPEYKVVAVNLEKIQTPARAPVVVADPLD